MINMKVRLYDERGQLSRQSRSITVELHPHHDADVYTVDAPGLAPFMISTHRENWRAEVEDAVRSAIYGGGE